MSVCSYSFLILPENLLLAWETFKQGKRGKKDVQVFERNLENNIFTLCDQLKNQTYHHGSYHAFYVQDPKRRHIHKASVRDRVIHHLLFTTLNQLYEPTFIYDSYSCRVDKGTHKGVARLAQFAHQVSANYSRTCWALQFDIKQFFASADHAVLKDLLAKRIADQQTLWLLNEVIDSFHSDLGKEKGIPLGNLTSQIFANLYLHELDLYVKHTLKVKYYIRYADDAVILATSEGQLNKLIPAIQDFLQTRLLLTLHPRKVKVRKLSWGIDFLGYIVLPGYILPRTKTKHRLMRRLLQPTHGNGSFEQMWQSYKGYLEHASSFKLIEQLENEIWPGLDKHLVREVK